MTTMSRLSLQPMLVTWIATRMKMGVMFMMLVNPGSKVPGGLMCALHWFHEFCYFGMPGLYHIDGLMRERRNFIANALQLRLSCTHPSICSTSLEMCTGFRLRCVLVRFDTGRVHLYYILHSYFTGSAWASLNQTFASEAGWTTWVILPHESTKKYIYIIYIYILYYIYIYIPPQTKQNRTMCTLYGTRSTILSSPPVIFVYETVRTVIDIVHHGDVDDWRNHLSLDLAHKQAIDVLG